MSRPVTVNARIRRTLAQVGGYVTAAELADMLDAEVADVSTRLSQLFRNGELDRRVGEGNRFEYASKGERGPRQPARAKPRRGPPAPVNAGALEERVDATAAEAAAEAAAEQQSAAGDDGDDGEPTLPGVVRRFLSGQPATPAPAPAPAPPALQQRGAAVLGQLHELAEAAAAADAAPAAVVQIIHASRALRAALATTHSTEAS